MHTAAREPLMQFPYRRGNQGEDSGREAVGEAMPRVGADLPGYPDIRVEAANVANTRCQSGDATKPVSVPVGMARRGCVQRERVDGLLPGRANGSWNSGKVGRPVSTSDLASATAVKNLKKPSLSFITLLIW